MFLEGNKPWIAATTRKGSRLFVLDTGAPHTTMYDLYWNENQDAFAGVQLGDIQFMGVGGNRQIPGFLAADVPLTFGDVSVVLHNIATLTKSHTDAPEVLYGCLGQDLLRPLHSWSLDFQSMHFQIDTGAGRQVAHEFKYQPEAGASPKTVHVAGDFNAWSTTATPLAKAQDGTFSAVVELTPGVHLYKFVVDGNTWVNDPAADKSLEADDGYGGKNSGVAVGEDTSTSRPN